MLMNELSRIMILAKSTLLLLVSLANRFQTQGNEPEPMTSATCGPTLPAPLAHLDPVTSSWKTFQASFPSMTGESLESYSQTWPRAGMMRSGKCYPQARLVHGTGGIASGLLPTYEARLVKMYPTPGYSSWKDRGGYDNPSIRRRRSLGKQIDLSMSVHPKSGKLNPDWVEWLMGYPTKWTESKPSATALSRRWWNGLVSRLSRLINL